MKVLYAIQGTGNGHLSRALEILPVLRSKCEVDVLVSGCEAEIDLPFPVKYQYKGLSFIFGQKGGIDYLRTYLRHNSRRFLAELRSLPVTDYDLVINDFEPVSAWAAKRQGIPCVALSNQAALLSTASPLPANTDHLGRFILRHYAPAQKLIGFHFDRYAPWIYTPIIRKQIRRLRTSNQGHYTVYLPAYKDKRLITLLNLIPDVDWQVFSKRAVEAYTVGNVKILPVSGTRFLQSFASCAGILCGAGFGTSAEALYLGKKLLLVPMKGQYEQQCNAAAVADLGVPVIKSLKTKYLPAVQDWVDHGEAIKMDYPDQTAEIIDQVLSGYQQDSVATAS